MVIKRANMKFLETVLDIDQLFVFRVAEKSVLTAERCDDFSRG